LQEVGADSSHHCDDIADSALESEVALSSIVGKPEIPAFMLDSEWKPRCWCWSRSSMAGSLRIRRTISDLCSERNKLEIRKDE
jgi:hypothetical protein